jgi:fimbrial chaperone protein
MFAVLRILRIAALVFIADIAYFSVPGSAMSVEPLVLDVDSIGNGANQSFRVVNDGADPMPVEIVIEQMEIGPAGEQRNTPANKDFIVYPPQANIPKGGAQVFRVQWIGDSEIKASRNFRFSVSQVPVKQSRSFSGVQFAISFGVIVSVSPPQSKASIVAVTATSVKGKDGKQAVALNVKNSGTKHAYLRDAAISLSGRGWSTKLTAYEVQQKVGLGIVQPGKVRRFLLPIEVPANVADITASIDFQPAK